MLGNRTITCTEPDFCLIILGHTDDEGGNRTSDSTYLRLLTHLYTDDEPKEEIPAAAEVDSCV